MVKLSEGLLDINNVLDQQHQSLGLLNQNNEQSSSLFEEPKDSPTDDSLILQYEDTIAQIIAKVFSL